MTRPVLISRLTGLALVAGLLLATPVLARAEAPAAPTTRADAVLSGFAAGRPGVSVLVARGDQLLYARSLGSADLEHAAPITPRTRFLIGSVSKQFTAFAATKLAFEHKLSLDADIHLYLPELADLGAKITVSDLIHHTSGLRDQVELMVLAGTPIEGLVEQRAALAMTFHQTGLNFAPGSDFRYSNANYTLLAEIVARVSGVSFREYLRREVFAPLGMTDSYLSDVATEIVPDRATGYTDEGTGVRRALLNYAIYGSTGVWSTPRDLLRWGRELLHPKVLDPALVRALETPGHLAGGAPMTYASALVVAPLGGRAAIYHAGADPGFQAFLGVFPAEDLVIIALSNADVFMQPVGVALADAVLGAATTAAPAPAPPSAAQLAALPGAYVNGWDPAVSIVARDGRLFLARGEARIPLQFQADGSFWFGAPSNRLTLRANGDLVASAPLSATPLVYRRITLATPSPEALATLAGAYRSPDIDTTFRIAAADGHLVLSSLRDAPAVLFPSDADSFETHDARYPALRLSFHRDRAGQVDGFSLATGRMRGLQFSREPK